MVSRKVLASIAKIYPRMCWSGGDMTEFQNHNAGVKNQISCGETSFKKVLYLEHKTCKKKGRWRWGRSSNLLRELRVQLEKPVKHVLLMGDTVYCSGPL